MSGWTKSEIVELSKPKGQAQSENRGVAEGPAVRQQAWHCQGVQQNSSEQGPGERLCLQENGHQAICLML